MKIKILRTTVADSKFVKAGEVVEVSDADAKTLILLGKAVLADGIMAHVEPEPEPEELTTEVAEAIVETKLKRSRKK
jgi:hypothetical protein